MKQVQALLTTAAKGVLDRGLVTINKDGRVKLTAKGELALSGWDKDEHLYRNSKCDG